MSVTIRFGSEILKELMARLRLAIRQYFPTFEALIEAVDAALTTFQNGPAAVRQLMGSHLMVMVAPEGVAADEGLAVWVGKGVAFAVSLPAK